MQDEAEGTFFVGVAFEFEENGIVGEREFDTDEFSPWGQVLARLAAALNGTCGAFTLFALGRGYYAFLQSCVRFCDSCHGERLTGKAAAVFGKPYALLM